jgi:LuxR family transcriptional regulator, maltose regulon positive regulatory protein
MQKGRCCLPQLQTPNFKQQTLEPYMKLAIPASLLSARQLQVLGLLCEGQKYSEVGKRLNISTATVRKHARNIYKTLGVKNKTQAMIKVYLS